MKTIGLIGGTSWVSTLDYYKLINEGVNQQLGGLNYSSCLIHSFNFAEIKALTDSDRWDDIFKKVKDAAAAQQQAGAQAIILCANTLHMVAERLRTAIDIPVVHIAEEVAQEIAADKIVKVGLLGTKFTMERSFFKDKLTDRGIQAIIPDGTDREFIHTSIFEELGKGIVTPETKREYLRIVDKLIEQGAKGLILGCTEIPLVLKPADITIRTYDTLLIHAMSAVRFQLG